MLRNEYRSTMGKIGIISATKDAILIKKARSTNGKLHQFKSFGNNNKKKKSCTNTLVCDLFYASRPIQLV